MGDFRIVIDAIGGHGQDREKKDGQTVDFFKDGDTTPEAIAVKFVNALKAAGCSVQGAKVIHWPADNYSERDPALEISDDLLTGVRKGSF